MTAELLARCWAELDASDLVAAAIDRDHRVWWIDPDPDFDPVVVSDGSKSAGMWSEVCEVGQGDEEAAFIANNDPATRLALNAALRNVLDSIEATLAEHPDGSHVLGDDNEVRCDCGVPVHWQQPCPHLVRALGSLAAIASALGVQEADRG